MGLLGVFSRLKKAKVLVAGDLMLDVYTLGQVKRISPEAPVSVLKVERENRLPGGAGNAILNMASLGMEVSALGRVGDDAPGNYIRHILSEENIEIVGIITDPGYHTPLKNRFIADNQQLLRVDHERETPLAAAEEGQVIQMLPALLENVSVVAVSDYAKGFLTPNLLAALIAEARRRGIPVIVDPKGSDFSRYRGATLIKPNLGEAIAAAKLEPEASLDRIANKIIAESDIEYLMVTRSQEGISIFSQDRGRQDFPAVIREVKDVTGAGDTVLAVVTAAIACGLSLEEGSPLANIAAGLAIERLGCARISLSELAHHLFKVDPLSKVFQEDHLFALKFVLRERPFTVVSIEGETGLSAPLFRALQKLSSIKERELLVYIRGSAPSEEFIHLLASLSEVDFIILQRDSLRHLCDQIHPQEAFLFEKGELFLVENSHALI